MTRVDSSFSLPCLHLKKRERERNIPRLCPRQIYSLDFRKSGNMGTPHRCITYFQRSPASFCRSWEPSVGQLGDWLPGLSSWEQSCNGKVRASLPFCTPGSPTPHPAHPKWRLAQTGEGVQGWKGGRDGDWTKGEEEALEGLGEREGLDASSV